MKLNRKLIIVALAIVVILFMFKNSKEMLQGDDKAATIKKMIDYVNANKTTLSKDPFFISSQVVPYITNKDTPVKIIEASGKNDFQTVISILKSL